MFHVFRTAKIEPRSNLENYVEMGKIIFPKSWFHDQNVAFGFEENEKLLSDLGKNCFSFVQIFQKVWKREIKAAKAADLFNSFLVKNICNSCTLWYITSRDFLRQFQRKKCKTDSCKQNGSAMLQFTIKKCSLLKTYVEKYVTLYKHKN